jgi:hypothetical protein
LTKSDCNASSLDKPRMELSRSSKGSNIYYFIARKVFILWKNKKICNVSWNIEAIPNIKLYLYVLIGNSSINHIIARLFSAYLRQKGWSACRGL